MRRELGWKLWEVWKTIAQRVGLWQSRFLLTVFYFLVVSPFALGLRILADPLRTRRGGGKSYWVLRNWETRGLESFRQQ